MRFASFALAALFSATAFCAPAAAYEIDPITREPVFYLPTAHRPQASATRRQLVSFTGGYAPGTVVVSTSRRRLYYVLGGGQAISYGVGVGRPGFTWAGTKTISMKREWPNWRPPAQMLKRRPDLPRYMSGGINNPLGARAMYLGGSMFRIHGSNEPETMVRKSHQAASG